MPVRPVLIRLLMWVVFLNTTVGAYLHQSLHLTESDAPLLALASEEATPPLAGAADKDQELRLSCAWCAAQPHHALIGTLSPTLARSSSTCLPGPFPDEALRPNPDRWPFAARDPPLILS